MSDPILDAFSAGQQQSSADDPILAAFGGAKLDVRQQIAYRKQSPPAAAKGDPNGDASMSIGEIAGAVGRGAAKIFGAPTDMKSAAIQYGSTLAGPAVSAATQATSMLSNAINAPNPVAAVPVVGGAINDLSKPAIATMQNRPPTNQENIGAIEGGTQLAGQAAMLSPTVQGAVGRAVAPIGKAVDAAGTALTETIPTKMSNAVIGATRKYFKFGANPGEAIRDMSYNSIEELPDRLQTEKIVPTSNQLNRILATDAAKTKLIDMDGAIQKAFTDSIEKAERDNNASLAETLRTRMQGRIDTAHKLSGGARYVNPDVAYKAMQQLGDDTKWTSDPVEGTVESAKQAAYQNLNAAVDTAIPAAVPLTRKLANALTAQKAIQTAIDTGQSTHPFIGALNTMRRVGAIGGAIGGFVSGHPEAAATGLALGLAPDVLTAAPVSSRILAGLSALARPEAPLPETTPSPFGSDQSSQFSPQLAATLRQRSLPPSRPQLLLPPAAENAPQGFITRPSVPSSGVGLPEVFRDPNTTDMGSSDINLGRTRASIKWELLKQIIDGYMNQPPQ